VERVASRRCRDEERKDKIQKSILLCHSHESGNPGVKDNKRKIDSRFRRNDIMGSGNDSTKHKGA